MSGLWFALQFQIRVAIDAAFLCAAVALPEDESDLEVEPCLQSVESRSKSQFVRMRGLEVARQGLAPCKAKCAIWAVSSRWVVEPKAVQEIRRIWLAIAKLKRWRFSSQQADF